MKYAIILATLIGLALGIAVRRSSEPPSLTADPDAHQLSTRSRSQGNPEVPPELSWGIRGNLTSSEIADLPLGAHRTAEFTLWSFNATSDELAAHWDQVIASGVKDMHTLDHLMTLWTRRHPEGALVHFDSTDQEYRFWWALGRSEEGKSLALALIDHRNKNFSALLRGIAYNDPDFARATLDENPRLNRNSVMTGVFESIFETDPAAAFDLAVKEGLDEWKQLNRWAARQPHEAFTWALKNQHLAQHDLFGPDQGKSIVPDLVAIIMEKDPAFATSAIAELPTGSLKISLLGAQAKHLAASNPTEALAFANSHQGQTRHTLLREIANGTAQSNPTIALNILNTLVSDDASSQGKVTIEYPGGETHIPGTGIWKQGFVDTLLTHDPDSVMALASTIEQSQEEASYRQTANLLFYRWQGADPQNAESWLSRQPAGEGRDQILDPWIKLAHQGYQADFPNLLSLSKLHSQEEKRSSNNSLIISSWLQRSPPEAAAFFNSNEASNAQKATYQKLLEKQ